jgi:hypothetical protein
MKRFIALVLAFLLACVVLYAEQPKEALRMVEINGGMPLGVELMKKLIDFSVEQSGGTVNAIRIFAVDMPYSWNKEVNRPEYSAYKRPIGKHPSTELHPHAMNKLKALLRHIKNKGYELKIQVVILNRCSAVERGWEYKYFSDEWWNKYHRPFIRKFVKELQQYEPWIIWEGCNESSTTASWEIRLSDYLKELGCKVSCSSPMSNLNLVKKHGKYDFLWLHGAWDRKKYENDYYMYHCNNLLIGFSGDGFSTLHWWIYGGGGSNFFQWDKRHYGRLPTKQYTIKQLERVNASNNHFSVNMSGAIERLEKGKLKPRWGYFRSILKAFLEAGK